MVGCGPTPQVDILAAVMAVLNAPTEAVNDAEESTPAPAASTADKSETAGKPRRLKRPGGSDKASVTATAAPTKGASTPKAAGAEP